MTMHVHRKSRTLGHDPYTRVNRKVADSTRLGLEKKHDGSISLERYGKEYNSRTDFLKFKTQLIDSLATVLTDSFKLTGEPPANWANELSTCCNKIEESGGSPNNTMNDKQLRFLLEVANKKTGNSSEEFKDKINLMKEQIISPRWYHTKDDATVIDKLVDKSNSIQADTDSFIKSLGDIKSLHVFEYGVHRGLSIKTQDGKKVRLDFYGGDGTFKIRTGSFDDSDPDNQRQIHGFKDQNEMKNVIRKYCNNSNKTINEKNVRLIPCGDGQKNCHQMLYDSLPEGLQKKVVNWLGITCSYGGLYEYPNKM